MQTIYSNPFDVWLLCSVNESCTDLSPMAMIAGRGIGNASSSWNGTFGASVQELSPGQTISFWPTPVCVWPPFVFIVYNGSHNDSVLHCSNDTCFYMMCWNASEHQLAVVARMPRYVPWPVEAPSAVTLFRSKRDFGITAAIITAIAVSATAATAAAVMLTTTVQTAATLNNLSAGVAEALDVQGNINSQLKADILLLNQRVDLVQEQVDVLMELAQPGYQWRYPGLCVTSVPFHNASAAGNLSRELSSYLTGNWSRELDTKLRELRQSIVHINSTRVDASLASGLTNWIL
uniref:uncharacterized protein LOC123455094 n=1 Tax=Jaculus jaculus TaxID=51337 RepID=UPI001E1AFEAA|nr:uncharacterized protein LOC123455094 [Jaculus jaculus]XP_044991103.1 uncharacterized protein LOC123455094 [Jaculus jaculus]